MLYVWYINQRKEGYLRPFSQILNPGDVQYMVFQDKDVGPLLLCETEREEQHHN